MKKIIHHSKKHKKKLITTGIVLLIILVGLAKNSPKTQEAIAGLKHVEVISLQDFKNEEQNIPLVGELKSIDQLDLRPQIPGQISAVRVSLNQKVVAGQILVELSHQDLNASVGQASASLQSAYATLEKMKAGARPEDKVQAQIVVDSARSTLEDAKINYEQTVNQNIQSNKTLLENSVQFIADAQISAEKILEQDLDDVFDSRNNNELVPVIESTLLKTELNRTRGILNFNIINWKTSTASLEPAKSLVLPALDRTITELNTLFNFLNKLRTGLNTARGHNGFTQTQLDTAKTNTSTALTTVKANIDSAISKKQLLSQQKLTDEKAYETAKTQIDNAQASLDRSIELLAIANSGARAEDITLQNAIIVQARASLGYAAAIRNKAIIRAPIAGTVTYLPVKISDIVSSSTITVSIANKEALEVETFISENELHFIAIGNDVLINDTIAGLVNEISPALDPVNKKIQVKITVTDESPSVTLGETVRLQISKTNEGPSITSLPLTSVKLTSDGAELLNVLEDNTLETIAVDIGEVSGNKIKILTPLPSNAHLVKDRRGLKDGQKVVIKE